MPLAPTTRLGPYEIVAALGAGGMGEVYRARDTRLARDVAVKVLPPALAQDAERQRRFEQEAMATAQINHPNILQVYDVGAHEGQPYLVTELLEGEALRERMNDGAIPIRKAIELAIPIASGLGAAHEHGIVHRDLKPENLFVTGDGRMKILDFGLAKLVRSDDSDGLTSAHTVEAQTGPGVVMGTAGYMSPEQVRGRKVDHRSDIFSFGVILYEMLSGRRAFHGETPADTMSAILREDPPDLTTLDSSIPLVLQMIVRHCLEKSAGERFRSAHDLAFQLEAISGSGSGAVSALADEPEGATTLRAQVRFKPITYRRGTVYSARFAADGETVMYAAAWDGGTVRLYMWRPESPEAIPVPLPNANLLAVSRSGTMAINLDPSWAHNGSWLGTSATVPMFGGTPREIEENVVWADFAPDGVGLAVARDIEGKVWLEYPIGKVLYETSGWVGSPRFSPNGEAIAFLDHPIASDDRGSVAIVDLDGNKKTLTPVSSSAQGLAWSPSGDEIFFTAEAEQQSRRSLHAVTPTGELRFVSGFPGTARLFDISSDGRMLLTRDDDRVGMIGRAAGEESERDLSWLDWSIPDDLSADGKTLLFEEDRASPDYVVCLRKMDGSPAVRLGEGTAMALSPDGRWVLARRPATDAPLQLLPTGAGRERSIPIGDIDMFQARWLPDGRRVLCIVRPSVETTGVCLLDVQSGKLEPLGVERQARVRRGAAVAPDGELAAVSFLDGSCVLIPLNGGEVCDGPRLEPGEEVVSFSADGTWLFVEQMGPGHTRVDRIHIESGRREPWKTLAPADASGIVLVFRARIALDGDVYAYGYYRMLSDLYIAEGLS